MKTVMRPTPLHPLLAATRQQGRQLSIAFETPVLLGLAADQRATAVQALAAMLLQAAGVQLQGDDDVEH